MIDECDIRGFVTANGESCVSFSPLTPSDVTRLQKVGVDPSGYVALTVGAIRVLAHGGAMTEEIRVAREAG